MVEPEQFREWALALPEAIEKETWGEATFRVRDKMFATLGGEGNEARGSVKASLADQAELVASNPAAYSVAAYVGRYGWVAVELSAADPAELRDLIVEAWRRTAPKRVVAAFNG